MTICHAIVKHSTAVLVLSFCMDWAACMADQIHPEVLTMEPVSADLADGWSLAKFADAEAVQGDWSAALEKALASLPDGGVLRIPFRAEGYRVSRAIEIRRSVLLQFDAGVRMETDGSALFRILGGDQIVFQGNPDVRLINRGGADPNRHAVRGHHTGAVSSVIDLNNIASDFAPRLLISQVWMEGFRCLDGVVGHRYVETGGGLTELRLLDCDFVASDIAVGHQRAEIGTLEVRGCRFHPEALYGLYVTSPISRGAQVSGNRFDGIGIGALQIGGGKAFAIDSGAVEFVKAAIVENNIIFGGGHLADEQVAYANGILVYGNAVTIHGNVVRDFNRGKPRTDGVPGHIIRKLDGGELGTIWKPDESVARGLRLAGAAIYAKFRHGIIANNVCVNSGWRAVIEVKTGGREPYAVISGNILDGTSLAIEDSFGIEANISRALWANNLLTKMPNVAVKLSNNMESQFTCNFISDSKIGFWCWDATPEPSLVQHNYFTNVETPVLPLPTKADAPLLTAPPMVLAVSEAALPAASAAHWGRMALLEDKGEHDRLLICRKVGTEYEWVDLTAGGTSVLTPLGPVSDNLLTNGDFSQGDPADRSFPPGFSVTINPTERRSPESITLDNDLNAKSGRVLRVGDREPQSFNCQLRQNAQLVAGKTYELRVRLQGSLPEASVSLIVDAVGQRWTHRFASNGGWEDGRIRFALPEGGDAVARIRVYAQNLGEGRIIWIDTMELYEIGRPDTP